MGPCKDMSSKAYLLLLAGIFLLCAGCNIFSDTAPIIWKFKTGYPLVTRTAVVNNLVYAGSDKMYCLDAKTGKSVWEFSTFGVINKEAVVADGKVYFQCGGLYCLDAATGKLLWEFWTSKWGDTSPAVFDKYVYTVIEGKVYCLLAENGQKLWESQPCGINKTPVFSDGRGYSGGDGQICCFDMHTGNKLWNIRIGETGDPVDVQASHDRVFAGTFGTKLYCVDADSGTTLWSRDMNSPVLKIVTVSEDEIYICAGALYCIQANTGDLLWEYSLDTQFTGRLLISGRYVYVKTPDGKIQCIDLIKREKLWAVKAPFFGTIADGYMYTGSTSAEVCCVKLPEVK
jgi:outer membrane protein assembly factor BamB